MKTAIFYVTLLVVSLWAFNAAAYDHLFISEAIKYVEQNEGKFPAAQIEKCEGIIGVGAEALAMRDEGLALQVALDDLHGSIEETERRTGAKMPTRMELEFSRMIYTVYRYPEMDLEAYNRQFFAECMALDGF